MTFSDCLRSAAAIVISIFVLVRWVISLSSGALTLESAIYTFLALVFFTAVLYAVYGEEREEYARLARELDERGGED